MNTTQIAITILIVIIGTQITRSLPFILFSKSEKVPPFIKYLSKVLPLSVLAILVVYCLKDLRFDEAKLLLANGIAISIIVIAHIIKRQVLLSILLGTLSYILLLNFLL